MPLAIFPECQAGWDHCTKDGLGREGGSLACSQALEGLHLLERRSQEDWPLWGQLRSNSTGRVRSGLREPQLWYGCPTPDKGRDVSSGRQSFYYLIIPSVVIEVPLWSPYSHNGCGWWEKRLRRGRGEGLLTEQGGNSGLTGHWDNQFPQEL